MTRAEESINCLAGKSKNCSVNSAAEGLGESGSDCDIDEMNFKGGKNQAMDFRRFLDSICRKIDPI